MCIINLSICASCFCISYMHPSRASSSLYQSVCKIGSASWQLHHVIFTISFAWEKFHHYIALALQSYISRVHHSHGHRAYASRICYRHKLTGLIYGPKSKLGLEQKIKISSRLEIESDRDKISLDCFPSLRTINMYPMLFMKKTSSRLANNNSRRIATPNSRVSSK